MQKRVHLMILGDVIGVGFRAWTQRFAQGQQLTGWVKNAGRGLVEAVFEGPEIKLKKMIDRCHQGPEVAWVKKVDVQWSEPTGEFMTFEIIY